VAGSSRIGSSACGKRPATGAHEFDTLCAAWRSSTPPTPPKLASNQRMVRPFSTAGSRRLAAKPPFFRSGEETGDELHRCRGSKTAASRNQPWQQSAPLQANERLAQTKPKLLIRNSHTTPGCDGNWASATCAAHPVVDGHDLARATGAGPTCPCAARPHLRRCGRIRAHQPAQFPVSVRCAPKSRPQIRLACLCAAKADHAPRCQ